MLGLWVYKDFKCASGSEYVWVLNMPVVVLNLSKFLMYQGFDNARNLNVLLFLKMPLILHMLELHRALNMPGYPLICPNMSKYV